jgi:hypothetical protein
VWTLQQPVASGRRVFSWATVGITLEEGKQGSTLPFAFCTSCCGGAAAGASGHSYGASVLKALPMLNRSILVRGAFIGLLLAGLVALADGIARYELQQATGGTAVASVAVTAEPADASDE